MRPVQDDYLFAANALESGILGSVRELFLNWNGGITAHLFLSFWGWTIGVSPWSTGYLAYLVGFITLQILTFYAIWRTALPGIRGLYIWALTLVSIPIWQLSVLGVGNVNQFTNAYTLFNWFSGANRFFFTELLILVSLRYLTRGHLLGRPSITAGLLIGLFLGFWNAPEALSVVAICLLVLVFGIRTNTGNYISRKEIISLATGALTAGLVNYFSPGSQIRQTALPSLGIKSMIKSIPGLFDSGVQAVFANSGYLLAAILALAVFWLLSHYIRFSAPHGVHNSLSNSGSSEPVNLTGHVLKIITLMGMLSAIQFVVLIILQAKTYQAPWHFLGIQFTIFVAICLLMFRSAHLLSKRKISFFIAFVSLILILVASQFIYSSDISRYLKDLEVRSTLWDTGASSYFGNTADRDVEWIYQSWIRLDNLRK